MHNKSLPHHTATHLPNHLFGRACHLTSSIRHHLRRKTLLRATLLIVVILSAFSAGVTFERYSILLFACPTHLPLNSHNANDDLVVASLHLQNTTLHDARLAASTIPLTSTSLSTTRNPSLSVPRLHRHIHSLHPSQPHQVQHQFVGLTLTLLTALPHPRSIPQRIHLRGPNRLQRPLHATRL